MLVIVLVKTNPPSVKADYGPGFHHNRYVVHLL